MEMFNYTFKLTSSVTQINLPYALKSKRLKVKFIRYLTASADQQLMLIKISHFSKNVYYDGSSIIHYSKSLALPNSSGTLLLFENQLPEPDVVIIEKDENSGINQLKIELLIDGAYSSDINAGNPLYVELQIY